MESLPIKFTDEAMLTKALGAVIKIQTGLPEVSYGQMCGRMYLGVKNGSLKMVRVRQKHSDASGFT